MNVNDIPLLSIITFLPLLGALVVAATPSSWTRPIALGFALATWVVSLFLLIGFLPTREGDAAFQYVETLEGLGVKVKPVCWSALWSSLPPW